MKDRSECPRGVCRPGRKDIAALHFPDIGNIRKFVHNEGEKYLK